MEKPFGVAMLPDEPNLLMVGTEGQVSKDI